jgi:hypothetical protein
VRSRWSWGVLPLLFVLAGCAGGGKSKPKAKSSSAKPTACTIASVQASVQSRCPQSECITAVGYSRLSVAEAEGEAKRRVAEQVNSTIRSEVENRRRSVESNGKEQITSDFWQRVVSTSDFTHGQLVQVETARACPSEGGGYIVPAKLDRAELARILAAESSRLTPSLRVSQQQALYSSHILSFSGPYNKAQSDFVRLYALAAQYRGVTGSALPEFEELDAKQTAVARKGRELVLSSRVETRLDSPKDMVRNAGAYRAALSDHLGKRGVLVGPAGDCPLCIVAEVKVTADLDPNFRFGPRCELSWNIEASDPSGHQSLNLGGGRVAAYSNKGDMDDAIARAWRRMADSAGVVAGSLAQLLGR